MKNVISTDKAPAAIGPYSQAIEVNGMVYTSGIIPVVPSTGEIPEGSVAQAKQAFENLSNLLAAAGTSMDKVVKTTVFIKEMNDFGAINEVYADFFQAPFPAAFSARCTFRYSSAVLSRAGPLACYAESQVRRYQAYLPVCHRLPSFRL